MQVNCAEDQAHATAAFHRRLASRLVSRSSFTFARRCVQWSIDRGGGGGGGGGGGFIDYNK